MNDGVVLSTNLTQPNLTMQIMNDEWLLRLVQFRQVTGSKPRCIFIDATRWKMTGTDHE